MAQGAMLSANQDRPAVRTARDAAELLAPLVAGAATERVAVAYFDGERRLVALRHADGRMAGEVGLPVRAILAEALDVGAAGLVVAHNHPSGDPTPSDADRAATRLLSDTARQLGIALHDHLIFGRECRSMRALGLI